MKVLGIETSCDETGVAIYDTQAGLRAQALHSQIATHARYGGVVPELASRDHIRKLAPMVENLLAEAELRGADIDGIAYTAGPGLAGALLVGAMFGQSLAFAWAVPAVAVHHMEGHLLAPMLEAGGPDFPFVALLVSGGHSLLVEVRGLGQYRLLGESIDDAAGEAFDKTAKLLGLPYPGGPALAALAETGRPDAYDFPRPLTRGKHARSLDFSFSGLKTHVVNLSRQLPDDAQTRADLARGFEDAVVETLAKKCAWALAATGLERLVVAGGVAANRRLRAALDALPAAVHYPRPEFCTDNGAMIAYAGAQRLAAGERSDLAVNVRPRWPLTDLAPPA